MKRIIFTVLVLGLIGGQASLSAGTGRSYGSAVITSSGVTGISFDKITKEIYAVTLSTPPVYINWVSSYVMTAANATNYFLLGIVDETDIIEHTEEVESSWMSVFSSFTAINIRIQWKMPQRP